MVEERGGRPLVGRRVVANLMREHRGGTPWRRLVANHTEDHHGGTPTCLLTAPRCCAARPNGCGGRMLVLAEQLAVITRLAEQLVVITRLAVVPQPCQPSNYR